MGVDAQMLIKVKQKFAPEVLNEFSYRLYDAFYGNPFWLRDDEQHILYYVNEYDQDGDTIYPKEGEYFIEVSLACRYYGPDYERGHFPIIYMIAEWIEAIIPTAQIFYGGDSGGICAEPFNKENRDKIKFHWMLHGHLPYIMAFGMSKVLCPRCDKVMSNVGGGGNHEFLSCCGCDNKFIQTPTQLVKLNRSEEFFTASQRVKDENAKR